MQQPMRMPAPLNTEAGRFQFISQSNEMYARPRRRSKRITTEAGFDALMALLLALGLGVWFVVGIVKGVGPVLRAHGI